MASKTSDPDDYGPVIDMTAYGRDLARRRTEIGAQTGKPLDVPRNSGTRRTESKRALLEAIDRLAAAKGFRW